MPRLSRGLRSRCQPSRLHRVRQGARCEGARGPSAVRPRAAPPGGTPRVTCSKRQRGSTPTATAVVADRTRSPPKVLEPVGCHVGVPDGVLNVLVPEIVLQGSRVVAIVGQLEPAGMAKHVWVDRVIAA